MARTKSAAREALVSWLGWSDETLDLGIHAEFRCEYCGKNLLESVDAYDRWQIDHIHPRAKGGSDEVSNKAVACSLCNRLKRHSLVDAAHAASRADLLREFTRLVEERRRAKIDRLSRVRAEIRPLLATDADALPWGTVWRGVANRLREHEELGRRGWFTEDLLRLSVALELQAIGVEPRSVKYEARIEGVGPVDLVVEGVETGDVALELKFPRDGATTMSVGELVNDFFRLAAVPQWRAMAVHLLSATMFRHLVGARREVVWPVDVGAHCAFDESVVESFPKTAKEAMKATRVPHRVTCTHKEPVSGLTLLVYEVKNRTRIGDAK